MPFVWAMAVGCVFQFFLYPTFFKSTYWGHGLVQGDWVYFHEMAIKFANTSQWSKFNFTLVPLELSPVYSLGLVYFITGIYEPWVYLPVNALVHGLSVNFIFLILIKMNFSPRVSFFSSLLFACLPSGVVLYSQIHRDGIVFLGYFTLIVFLINYFQGKKGIGSFLLLSVSILLMSIFRPYLLNVYSVIIFIFFIFYIFYIYFIESKIDFSAVVFIPITVICFYLGQNTGQVGVLNQSALKINSRNIATAVIVEEQSSSVVTQVEAPWCVSENIFDRIFPDFFIRQLCSIQKIRARAIANFPRSRSSDYFEMNAYTDLRVDTPTRVLLAIPTLLKIAFVEPTIFLLLYKKKWTLFSYISFFETCINLFFVFVFLTYIYLKKVYILLLPLFCSTFFLLLISASSINLGTFYRLRFGYLLLISVIGLACVFNLFLDRDKKNYSSTNQY